MSATRRPEPESIETHRRFLWGLCYRMTGSATEAEDLVQETFVKALTRPPPDTTRPLRPWLTRVAMNLARDHLRRRKRRQYVGTWLPEPVETGGHSRGTGGEPEPALGIDSSPEARYGAMESASYAFLVALEVLTASQRAVLLMRDVLDHSVRETAEALDMSEANVKTTLHRARKTMETYDQTRTPRAPQAGSLVADMLARMMACLASGSMEEARALLAEDVRSLSDGGGVTFAARAPVIGREKVARMYMKLATRSSRLLRVEIRDINGSPALIGEDPDAKAPNAERFVLSIDLDAEGRVQRIYSVLAPPKLARIRAVA